MLNPCCKLCKECAKTRIILNAYKRHRKNKIYVNKNTEKVKIDVKNKISIK